MSSSQSKPVLKLDWCSYEAAKYAVEKWHYSGTMPKGKNVYIGAWEDGSFVGAIIFGTGAGAVTDGKSYGLGFMQMAELVRVALKNHATPVSRMIAIATRMMRKNSPGLRLFVSFADPFHGHAGGIYQAAGWIYVGDSAPSVVYDIQGKTVHSRSFNSGKWMGAAKPIPPCAVKMNVPGKHKYLMPLDDAMRQQIEPLRKPYPKRAAEAKEIARADTISEIDGASPIQPLYSEELTP